jgi:hypothetical protein
VRVQRGGRETHKRHRAPTDRVHEHVPQASSIDFVPVGFSTFERKMLKEKSQNRVRDPRRRERDPPNAIPHHTTRPRAATSGATPASSARARTTGAPSGARTPRPPSRSRRRRWPGTPPSPPRRRRGAVAVASTSARARSPGKPRAHEEARALRGGGRGCARRAS